MGKKLFTILGAVLVAVTLAVIMAVPLETEESYDDILNPDEDILEPLLGEELGASGYEATASPQHKPTPIPQEIADSNNDFAIDFYRQVSDSDKNIFFSPASMYTAFSVLYEGARENTASQMRDVFGFEADDDARHNATEHMMASLNHADPHTKLTLANALWLADWFEPHDAYLDIARNTYLADTESVDFGNPDDGIKRINDWAANKTNDKIKDVIDGNSVNAGTSMVITNAIYFKGKWANEFPKEDTRKSDFWTDGNSSKEADFMNTHASFLYAESDGAQVLRLPYKGDRLAMLVILPTERNGLAALEESVSAQQIDSWIHNMREREIIVSMPKFETKTKYSLNNPLKSMGMTDAFGSGADLSGIAPGGLYVDEAVQDAFIKVDEKGTEAAAVTLIHISHSGDSMPKTFVADHPFLFTIYDEDSGMILFMGRISDPTA